MNRQLHIVCAVPPMPADSGCAIDTLQRIKVLHALGIGIHLHYFGCDEKGMANELNQYCETISRYHKCPCSEKSFSGIPNMISCRINEQLITRLNEDDLPILAEGIQCTGFLNYINTNRKMVVRLQPVENCCSRSTAELPGGWKGKFLYWRESARVQNHLKHLPANCLYACFSEREKSYLNKTFSTPKKFFQNDKQNKQTVPLKYLPAFSPWQAVKGKEGQGNFCLFHGNLSAPENEAAAIWLVTKVFIKTRIPLIIAGKKPSRKLYKLSQLCQHTCLVADPSSEEMNDLVRKAQVNVLPCFRSSPSGSRLKLLHALFEGRHCLVNDQMVAGSGLQDACYIANSSSSFASVILQLYHLPFTPEERVLRKELLCDTYDNEKNARLLTQWLW